MPPLRGGPGLHFVSDSPCRAGNGGVLFPGRKRTKSALKGAGPLENPLHDGGNCFCARPVVRPVYRGTVAVSSALRLFQDVNSVPTVIHAGSPGGAASGAVVFNKASAGLICPPSQRSRPPTQRLDAALNTQSNRTPPYREEARTRLPVKGIQNRMVLARFCLLLPRGKSRPPSGRGSPCQVKNQLPCRPEGGKIRISAGRLSLLPEIHLPCRLSGQK